MYLAQNIRISKIFSFTRIFEPDLSKMDKLQGFSGLDKAQTLILTAPPPHGRYPFISKGFRGYYFIHLFTNSYIFLSSATNKNGLWPIFI